MDAVTRPQLPTRSAHIGIRTLPATKEAAEGIAWRRGQTLTQWAETLILREIRRSGNRVTPQPETP